MSFPLRGVFYLTRFLHANRYPLSLKTLWSLRGGCGAAKARPSRTPSRGELLVRRERHLDVALDVFDRARRRRHHVEIKDFRRQPQRGAGVGHVDHAGDMALAWRGAEDRIGLRAGIAELFEILDRVKTRLAVGDVDIEIGRAHV